MALRFLLLVVLTCVAYAPASRCGFIWDDDQYVEHNPVLRSGEGLRRIWFEPSATPQYYPLVFSTFWIEYQLWGLDAKGYHWVNVLLHGLNAGLLFLVFRELQVPGAWWAAAIFAVHPVHVESVAWITERKNVLSGLFYLGAMLCFLRYRFVDEDSPVGSGEANARPQARGSPGWYAAALVLFVAALLSKTVTCSLPAVLVLILWWKRGRVERRDRLALAPMFVVGFALAMHTAYLEKVQVLAKGEDWAFSPVERCLIAGRALWFYAGKLVWPHPLIFSYPRWHIDASEAWQYAYPLAALAVLVVLFLRREKWGRGPLVACLVFAGSLVPALGFFDVYPMIFSFVADHFQYLASAALIALAVAGVCELGRRRGSSAGEGRLGGVALLAVIGYLTWQQCGVYLDLETLWRDTLAKNSDAWLAHLNLGTKRLYEGYHDEAAEHLRRVLEIRPHEPRAYVNLGKMFAEQKKYREAEDMFDKAIQHSPPKEDVYFNPGLVRVEQGKYEESLPYLEKSIALLPQRADGHFQMGRALLELGRTREAMPYLRRAVELRPDRDDFRQVLEEGMRRSGGRSER